MVQLIKHHLNATCFPQCSISGIKFNISHYHCKWHMLLQQQMHKRSWCSIYLIQCIRIAQWFITHSNPDVLGHLYKHNWVLCRLFWGRETHTFSMFCTHILKHYYSIYANHYIMELHIINVICFHTKWKLRLKYFYYHIEFPTLDTYLHQAFSITQF